MAPVKFGLFKARSRDQEQPSTENLLQSPAGAATERPSSPLPSTSKGADFPGPDIGSLHLDSDDEEDIDIPSPPRKASDSGTLDESQVAYQQFRNDPSMDATSISTLACDSESHQEEDLDDINSDNFDGASTSCDANSLQFDATSLTFSEDTSIQCGPLKRIKKARSREEEQLRQRDFDMWKASNVEVLQNLLSRSGSLDEQIKWEAIATARGLCTLTNNCACKDCSRGKLPPGVTDCDGGIGAAPLFSTVSVGCSLQ